MGETSGGLFLRVVGDGLPVVVLHGGPDFDHRYLLPEMDGLARDVRLVYYDQRGRGRSFTGAQEASCVSMATELDDLDGVRRWLGVESVALLGHSWGGVLAMAYAIRHPDRVSHLVLVGTAPASHAGALAVGRALAGARTADEVDRLAALRDSPGFVAGDIDADLERYRIHFRPAVRDPEHLEALLPRLRAGFTNEGVVAARAIETRLMAETLASDGYDLTPQLRELAVPTLVVHGDSDFIPIDVAREVAASIPGARFVTVADCGHFPYLEQPERFRAVVSSFLSAP